MSGNSKYSPNCFWLKLLFAFWSSVRLSYVFYYHSAQVDFDWLKRSYWMALSDFKLLFLFCTKILIIVGTLLLQFVVWLIYIFLKGGACLIIATYELCWSLHLRNYCIWTSSFTACAVCWSPSRGKKKAWPELGHWGWLTLCIVLCPCMLWHQLCGFFKTYY